MQSNKIQSKEIFRFLIGGSSAVITDYIVYRLLFSIGVTLSLSKGISFIVGSVVGFIINKFWTFESKTFLKEEILKYIMLYGLTVCANIGVNKIVLILFASKEFAFLCATGTSTILNFLGQKYFVFHKKGDVK